MKKLLILLFFLPIACWSQNYNSPKYTKVITDTLYLRKGGVVDKVWEVRMSNDTMYYNGSFNVFGGSGSSVPTERCLTIYVPEDSLLSYVIPTITHIPDPDSVLLITRCVVRSTNRDGCSTAQPIFVGYVQNYYTVDSGFYRSFNWALETKIEFDSMYIASVAGEDSYMYKPVLSEIASPTQAVLGFSYPRPIFVWFGDYSSPYNADVTIYIYYIGYKRSSTILSPCK